MSPYVIVVVLILALLFALLSLAPLLDGQTDPDSLDPTAGPKTKPVG